VQQLSETNGASTFQRAFSAASKALPDALLRSDERLSLHLNSVT
jgi:hypothetical protein